MKKFIVTRLFNCCENFLTKLELSTFAGKLCTTTVNKGNSKRYKKFFNSKKYMIVLIIIFILLFAFSCAALAITDEYEHKLLLRGWNNLDNETKAKWEKFGDCCGFDRKNISSRRPCHSQTKSEVKIVKHILCNTSKMLLFPK